MAEVSAAATVDAEQHDDTVAIDQQHDECKIFVSRIPTIFDEAPIQRLLQDKLGEGSVVNVALIYPQEQDEGGTTKKHEKKEHRGFCFVTLDSHQRQQEALALGTVRGGVKPTSTKKYTLYLRPIVRHDDGDTESHPQNEQGVCFLWTNHRCPYGDNCKFAHTGEGSCLPIKSTTTDAEAKKKKKKCFNFRKGKCKAGEECPFSHDFKVPMEKQTPRKDSEKDCITWKKKGKCNKGDACPYRHDESLQKKALDKKKRKLEKERQPLSVRVFGLNYDTSEQDIREYFNDCGPIVELTFPTFEDSGRSKGYCGILFQSPKAVAKAIELDGKELHGRWLRVQAGKMYLKQWEEQHASRKQEMRNETGEEPPEVGEFGQKIKRRKQHGFKE